MDPDAISTQIYRVVLFREVGDGIMSRLKFVNRVEFGSDPTPPSLMTLFRGWHISECENITGSDCAD